MTLDKAIEILQLIIVTPPSGVSPDFIDAEKLGVEALKHLKECWEARVCERIYLLPGETED